MKQLKYIEIAEDIYHEILASFPSQIVYKEDIYNYFYGFEDKNKIYYDDNEYIVIKECKFNYIYKKLYGKNFLDNPTDWKQCRLRLNKEIDGAMSLPNGTQCYNFINKRLKKYYSDEEIEDILNSHEEEYNEEFKQFHYTYPSIEGLILKFKNCYKYDITKAHASAIIALFPKAKPDIIKLLKEAQKFKKQGNLNECQRYKNYVNLYVGALCRHGHRGTYYYIVHSVTKKLIDTYKYTGGKLLYANTDSFTICKPNNILEPSKEVGEFKLEYQGDIYIYQDTNYWLMEYGNEQVGSCKKFVRKHIKLSEGIVAHYTQNRIYIGTDSKDRKHFRLEIKNICTEKVNVVEHL